MQRPRLLCKRQSLEVLVEVLSSIERVGFIMFLYVEAAITTVQWTPLISSPSGPRKVDDVSRVIDDIKMGLEQRSLHPMTI